MESTVLANESTNSAERGLDVAVVAISGRLDALQAGELRQLLQGHIDDGTIRLVVDLSTAEFVDSAGLAALVRGMKQARSSGGDLRLVAPQNPEAMRVFELTRFDKVFTMTATLEEALLEW